MDIREKLVYSKQIEIVKEDSIALHSVGWNKNFDWYKIQKQGYKIFGLYLACDDSLQGLIAIEHRNKDLYTYIRLLESAPWNIGSGNGYDNVGATLVAIACRESWDNGNEGYVVLEPKTDLIDHYAKEYGAVIFDYGTPPRMMIDSIGASKLIKKYLYKED